MITTSILILVLSVKRSYKKQKASKSITLYFLKRIVAKTGFVDLYPTTYIDYQLSVDIQNLTFLNIEYIVINIIT